MAGVFGNNIPTPAPKPESIQQGESWFDGIFDTLTNTFNTYANYENSKFWRDWQLDQQKRSVEFEQQLATASAQNSAGSISTNTIITLGLVAVGGIVALRLLK